MSAREAALYAPAGLTPLDVPPGAPRPACKGREGAPCVTPGRAPATWRHHGSPVCARCAAAIYAEHASAPPEHTPDDENRTTGTPPPWFDGFPDIA